MKNKIYVNDVNLLEDLESMIDRWKDSSQKVKNVLDLYLCRYDSDHIGVFEKFDDDRYYLWDPSIGSYIEIDENHIGKVKKSHIDKESNIVFYDDVESLYLMKVDDSVPFESMRYMMNRKYEISGYRIGSANLMQVISVMIYAHEYFLSSKEKNKK